MTKDQMIQVGEAAAVLHHAVITVKADDEFRQVVEDVADRLQRLVESQLLVEQRDAA